jgi:oxalate decarboxylase/phosphoglucose isomerase-like protein (cupin superfamily)
VEIIQLDESTDARGLSFSVVVEQLERINSVKDLHIAAILPGHVRGNHYHTHRSELITVLYQDSWSLHWDTGAGTEPHHRSFMGTGAVAIYPPLGWSHAVRNDGDRELWIVVASDEPYDRHEQDESARDAIRRIVTVP